MSPVPRRGPKPVFAPAAAFAAVLCGVAPCSAGEPAVAMSAGAESAGATVFAERCAVCHGPQAAGIPGSFPSLHEQVVAFAKMPQGRDYLVMVVTTGLMGGLKVGGVSYNGVMPAQSGLSEAEVAAVLNYLASDLGKNTSAVTPLSAGDVTDARARHPDQSAQATRALRPATEDTAPAGVGNAQRAWQNWTLNCQGCHRPDGSGTEGTAPSLSGIVARFLSVPGGREYLARVPGVATSPLSNADLAEVVNWMLWRFDREHLPAQFEPYTADEMGRLRIAPLRMEASPMRAALLKRADESQTP